VYVPNVVDRVPKLRLVREKRAGLSEYVKECIEIW
jgi:hypothetical protein